MWWVINATPRPLPPGEDKVPIVYDVLWAQGRSGRVRKISPPPGLDPRTVPIATELSRPICICALLKTLAMVA